MNDLEKTIFVERLMGAINAQERENIIDEVLGNSVDIELLNEFKRDLINLYMAIINPHDPFIQSRIKDTLDKYI